MPSISEEMDPNPYAPPEVTNRKPNSSEKTMREPVAKLYYAVTGLVVTVIVAVAMSLFFGLTPAIVAIILFVGILGLQRFRVER